MSAGALGGLCQFLTTFPSFWLTPSRREPGRVAFAG